MIEFTWTDEFPEPTSIQEALSREAVLADEILNVQTQLGEKKRQHADGRLYSYQEYESWRKRAKFVWRMKHAHLRMLKDWRRQQKPDITSVSCQSQTRQKNIAAAFSLLIRDVCANQVPNLCENDLARHYLTRAEVQFSGGNC